MQGLAAVNWLLDDLTDLIKKIINLLPGFGHLHFRDPDFRELSYDTQISFSTNSTNSNLRYSNFRYLNSRHFTSHFSHFSHTALLSFLFSDHFSLYFLKCDHSHLFHSNTVTDFDYYYQFSLRFLSSSKISRNFSCRN